MFCVEILKINITNPTLANLRVQIFDLHAVSGGKSEKNDRFCRTVKVTDTEPYYIRAVPRH